MIGWFLSRVRAMLESGSSLADPPAVIGRDELLAAVKAAAPDAFAVEPRILRRVIRQDHGVGMLGRPATGRRCYAIEANRAAYFLDRDELGLPPEAKLPTFLLLLALPEARELAARPADAWLLETWRLLYHARVLAEMKALAASGYLDQAAVRGRIDRIGQAEFDEVRTVLRQEHYVQDAADPIAHYVEFVALYAELRDFAPDLVPRYFPSLGDSIHVDSVIAEDLDLDALRARCRPPGAPDPPSQALNLHDEIDELADDEPFQPDEDAEAWTAARWMYRVLIRKANQAAVRGNHVRAAIRRMRACRFAPPGRVETTRESAQREIERLAHQLGPALGLTTAEVSLWRKALPPLIGRARRGIWSREARLLYDLQKVVVDHDREIYAVDLFEWARTLGRRPIKRPLPYHRDVLIVQHLVSACRRQTGIRLLEADRERLSRLLNTAVDRAKRRLRERFRPVVAATLERTGWHPANLPERLALEKLTDEILDRIVNRGFLSMGDLRDAISRNRLKLPDLAGPWEFLRGDRLLQTDHALAVDIDGVYRRGEIYLRVLQRGSSLAFGTRIGRLLTLFVAMPFGTSFVVLEGLNHLINPLMHWIDGPKIHVYNRYSFLTLGFLLVALVNFPKFRSAFVSWIRDGFRLARQLVVDLPRWALRHPVLRLILESPPVRFLVRWGLKPSIFALGTTGLLRMRGVPWLDTGILAAVAFVTSALLLNSRTGRDVEEILADRAVRFWQRFLRDLIPGLFRMILEVFDRLLEALDRVLYAVDEWLRFKSDQSRLALAGKAVVGLFWSVVTYVVRVYVVLLIEPQVNPIKHFPVVTVSHKLMIPFLPALLVLLRTPLMPLGRVVAETIAWVTLLLLPGVFGFLVWELKENWKLYKANRARELRPVVIGHHGETMLRLVCPGFHSGTIPKLFAKLRRAESRAILGFSRPWWPKRKYQEQLHHVEEEIRNFVNREFLALLNLSRSLSGSVVTLDEIHLGINRVHIRLGHLDHPAMPMVLSFEEQSGWLVAGVAEPGWLGELTDEERATLRDALAGLYKLAGVNLIREQIEGCLGPEQPPYDINDQGLVVWPDADYRQEILISLDRDTPLLSSTPDQPLPDSLAGLGTNTLSFRRVPIPWTRWVNIWDQDHQGRGHATPAAPGVRLLPGTEPTLETGLAEDEMAAIEGEDRSTVNTRPTA